MIEAQVKLRGGDTGESIMIFRGDHSCRTKSTFHLHHDSDKAAYAPSGELTFKIGDEITVKWARNVDLRQTDAMHRDIA